MAENEVTKKNVFKVIIIGAGMGGIAAANTLLRNGIANFIILEARNKIGGRIEVVEAGNHKLEMGANYIHGILGNPMYELALSHGLIDITHSPKVHNVVAAMEDGSQVPFSILQEIFTAYICFMKRCEEYFNSEYLPPESVTNVGDHIRLEVEMYLNQTINSREKHIKHLIFDCLLKRETCITGCDDMKEVDLVELGSYIELPGGNVVLPSGYSSLIEAIASEIPPECLVLDHPVSVINWTMESIEGTYFEDSGNKLGINLLGPSEINADSDKAVEGKSQTTSEKNSMHSELLEGKIVKDNKKNVFCESVSEKLNAVNESSDLNTVEIICENGEKFYGHHIICTIPLGVLKEKASKLFKPELPQDKIDSINKLSFGTVDKIYLEYSKPFLQDNISEVMLLWDSAKSENDKESMDLETSWYKKIYSFSKISDTLILGWISGKEARFMETLPSVVVGEKCTEILRKFLNDPYIPLPKLCLPSRWHSNEFFRGSYTSIAVGATQKDIKKIAQPLCAYPQQKKPILLFAGEHTHCNFYSTAHGAYLSGEMAATIILPENELNEFQGKSETEEKSKKN